MRKYQMSHHKLRCGIFMVLIHTNALIQNLIVIFNNNFTGACYHSYLEFRFTQKEKYARFYINHDF